jgi:hypothetical protein
VAQAGTAQPAGKQHCSPAISRSRGAVLVAVRLSASIHPYITILLVLHIVVPLLLVLEQTTDLQLWVYGAIVLPLATILTIVVLPLVKGGMIGVLFKLGADKDMGNDDGHEAGSR